MTTCDHPVDEHLARIGSGRPDRADLAALTALQESHLLAVPFENLDIHRGIPIVLDPPAIAAKVIARRRGGYCYEVNSTFGVLLTALGFEVDLVAAQVVRETTGPSQEFAHVALLVRAEDASEPVLVDVAFGDAFTRPLPLRDRRPQPDRDRRVRLARHGDKWHYEEDHGAGWAAKYTFTTAPRRLADFAEMNEWQQTSPDSHFTQQPMCSRLTRWGRVTMAGDRLLVSRSGERTERTLAPDEIEAVFADPQVLVDLSGVR